MFRRLGWSPYWLGNVREGGESVEGNGLIGDAPGRGLGVNVQIIYRECYPIFKQPQIVHPQDFIRDRSQMTATALKVVGITSSYLSAVFGINAAESVTANLVMKKFFAAGEVMTWGSLSAWSAHRIVDRMMTGRHSYGVEVVKSCSRLTAIKLYWAALMVVSFCSEIPTLYISYKYEREETDIAWGIFSAFVGTFFDSQSMDALTQVIANSNNLLTRHLYSGTAKITAFQARENLCDLLAQFLTQLLTDPTFPYKLDILDLVSNEEDAEGMNKALLKMLSMGLEHKMKLMLAEPEYVKKGTEIVRVVGSLPTLVEYFIEGMLVYAGTSLVIDNELLIALIVVMGLIPSIYLSVDLNREAHANNFQKLTNLKRSDFTFSKMRDQAPVSAGYACAIWITILGLGSSVAIIRDLLGLEWWSILIMIVALSSSLIVGQRGMTSFVDYARDKVGQLRMSEDERDMADFKLRIKRLIEYFQNMPAEAFDAFVKGLAVDGLDIRSLAGALSNHTEATRVLKMITAKVNVQS